MKSSNEKTAGLKILLGAFIISFSGVYVKIATVGPDTAGFYRVFIGGVILLVMALIQKQAIWKDTGTFCMSALCGLIFALNLLVWHGSIHFIGPGLATIMGNFQVFIVALAGVVLLGETLSIRHIVSMPIAMIGLFMVVGKPWQYLDMHYKTGLLLGGMTALCYSGYLLMLRKIQSDDRALSAVANLAVTCLWAAFFSGLFVLVRDGSLIIPDMKSLVALTAYGSLSQVLGWMLIMSALPFIRASISGLLLLVQPAMSFVWDISFFDLAATLPGLIGIGVTLGAIYVGATARETRR